MAAASLTQSSTSVRHRFKKFRRCSPRQNGYFTVTAEKPLTLLDSDFQPSVAYSLKKQGRWRLRETVNNDPGEIFDADISTDVEINVSDSTQSVGRQYYLKGSSGTLNINQSTSKRRRRVNINSLRSMIRSSEVTTEEETPFTQVTFVDADLKLQKKKRKVTKQNSIRKLKSMKAKHNVHSFIDNMIDEVDDSEEFEEEEEEEDQYLDNDQYDQFEEQKPLHTLNAYLPISEHKLIRQKKQKQQLAPSHEQSDSSKHGKKCNCFFMDCTPAGSASNQAAKEEESKVKTPIDLEDKVSMIPSFLRLPSAAVTSEALSQAFGKAYWEGCSRPRLFAINISEMLRIKSRLPQSKEYRHLQAYLIFELLADQWAVRLNASVNDDSVYELHLPPVNGEFIDLASYIDTCVDHCIQIYPSISKLASQEKLLMMTGYRFPIQGITIRLASFDKLYETIGGWCPPDSTGRPNFSQPSEDNAIETECGICFDALELGNFSSLLACGHVFCQSCWRKHLIAEIRSGNRRLRCPGFDCDQLVDPITRLRYVSVGLQGIHFRNVLSSALDIDPDIIWCPNRHCSRPIRLTGLSQGRLKVTELPCNVRCLCQTLFCTLCRQEAHWPAPCDAYKAYAAQLHRLGDWNHLISFDEDSMVRVRTKPCPKCNRRWEKNGGCNHMTCRTCGADYCWYCLKLAADHTMFPCSIRRQRPEEEARQDTTVIRQTVSNRRPPSCQRSATYCEAVHLRSMTVSGGLQALRHHFGRLTHRAVTATAMATELAGGQAETADHLVLRLLMAVSETARAAQFSLVAAMHTRSRERAAVFRCFAGRFESLTKSAMEGLRQLQQVENSRTRAEAIQRLRSCHEGGRGTARMLQAVVIGWQRDDAPAGGEV